MSFEWPEVRLEDVTSILGDGLHGTPNYDENGEFYFINGNNLSNGKIIIDEKTKRASKEEHLKYKKNLNDKTILVSINGTIGNVGLYNGEKVFLGKSACYFNVLEDVDKQFIRYVVTNSHFQSYLNSFATGSTIKNVSLRLMRDYTFRLPPLEVQKQISKVLEEFDNKIELNRQINQTLEQIAQAIFKSWFVDFEPVRAKIAAIQNGQDPERAAMRAISGKTDEQLDQLGPEQRRQLETTAALFPDELVESELGEIPKGWVWKKFGDVVENFDSKRIPLSKKQREERKGNYPYYGAATLIEYVNDYIFDGTYVLMAEDGSVMDSNGYPTIQYVWGKFWVNNHAHILKGVGSVSDGNILLYLKNTIIAPYVTGAVQMKINQNNMNSMPFLKASDDLHLHFSALLKPLYSAYQARHDENLSLISSRDRLLPKLLSGELSVS